MGSNTDFMIRALSRRNVNRNRRCERLNMAGVYMLRAASDLVFPRRQCYHQANAFEECHHKSGSNVPLRKIIGIAAVVVFVFGVQDALAWGPATHVKLAGDLLAQLSLLPATVAGILARHGRDYLFGNIAADVVIAKKLSRVKQVCHHWDTGFSMYEDSPNERGKAFALGYLSHLAADTVAHNKFVPRQTTITRSTLSFGHLYWELRADSTIGPHHWNELRNLLEEMFSEHKMSLSNRLTDTFLPFSFNWQMFYKTNRFVSRRGLHRVLDKWYRLSRWQLSDQLMRDYRAECLERMRDVLTHGRQSPVLHEDPNGNAALTHTRMQRRLFRRMARCGLIAPHILYEAAAAHAPSLSRNETEPLTHIGRQE